MERNPFTYGSEVSGAQFWDREDERRVLKQDIANSQNVVLYSKRRMGKTSLVKEVLRGLPEGKFIHIYIDLYPTNSADDFVGRYALAVAQAIRGPFEKALDEIKSLLRSFTPSLTIDDEGKPVLSLDVSRNAREDMLLDEVLEALPEYCRKKKRQGVIALDEFQQVGIYDENHRLEAALRSHFQGHKDISYIFLGSKKHLLMDIFAAPNRPFYHSSKLMPLGEIKREIAVKYVVERFADTGFKIDDTAAEHLVERAENHPYYTQRLAHSVWDDLITKKRQVDIDAIDSAFAVIVKENGDYFRSLCELLTTNQLKAIKTAARIKEGDKIFSKDFLGRFAWQKDSLKQTLDALVEKDMVSRENGAYMIDDVFFKDWLIQ